METLVTIALLTVGVLGIAGCVAAIERIAGVNQSQSQLEVAMRQFADWVRDSSNTTCGGTAGACRSLPYALCASPATYTGQLANAKSAGALTPPSGATLTVKAVYQSTSGTHDGASSTPQMTCSGSCPGSTCVGDWGVQEIVLSVSSGVESVTRTIWKSYDWCWQGQSPAGSPC